MPNPPKEEKYFKLIVEASPNAMIMVNREGKISLVNKQTEILFGYQREELIGKRVEMLIPKRFRAHHPMHRENFFHQPATRSMGGGRDLFGQHKDGREVPVEIGLNPIETSEGLYTLASIIDITARKKMDQALQESEYRLRLSQQAAHIGVFDWNIQTGVNIWTPELEAMYGLSPGSFAKSQQAWESLVHPNDREQALQKVNVALQTGETVEGEWRVIWSDGSVRWLAARFQMFRDELGKPLRLTGVNLDITERKKTEENLKMFSADLERRVAERTRELEISNRVLQEKIREAHKVTEALKETQEQLLESQKMEAVGKLAGGIAHDFNNILGGILGYVSLLEERFSEEKTVAGQIGAIENLAERGAKLTQELLGFARQGKYEKRIIGLNHQIAEIELLLSASIGKNILIKKKLAKDLWPIEGDSNQIMQILMNLGLNARDAMPDGGIITITTENVEVNDGKKEPEKLKLKPGQYVCLAFADTGCGVSPEIRNRIYDPFFTTKAPGKGTGLGLSMVYGIMQNHGGSIVLDSAMNQGTRFHLFFPTSDKSPILEDAEPKAAKKKISPLKLKNKMILVVDDEPHILHWVRESLAPPGCQSFVRRRRRKSHRHGSISHGFIGRPDFGRHHAACRRAQGSC